MLNYNSPINNKKEYSDLIISEIEPIIKINLRGKKRDFLTKIGKSLSIIPPTEANTSSGNDNLNIIWLSPDEWMVYSNNKIISENDNYKLEDYLFNEISKMNCGSVTNVTDQWVMINLKGDNVFELLSTSCPLNFNKFKKTKGSVVQSIMNHIDVIIHHKNINDINLFVRRSFSNHLWSWMNDSARFL
jgi:sarcosine oxidase subunit gamma